MQIDLVPPKEIEVEVSDVKFIFRAATRFDVLASAYDFVKREQHAWNALVRIDGELVAGGEILSLDRVKELGSSGQFPAAFSFKVVNGWATKVLDANGFTDQKEGNEEARS